MIRHSAERLAGLAVAGRQNNPFVAWDNALRRATLSGDAVTADGARENAATWSTYDRWRPTGDGAQQIIALIGADETPVSFLGLAAHNLAAIGATVQWAYNVADVGGTWVDLEAVAADDGPMAWRFVPVTARRWRLSVTVPSGKSANVGVIFIGTETVIPTTFYQGFAPRILPTEIELDSNVSEGGNLLATAVVRQGSTMSASLTMLPERFVRGQEFIAFMEWFNRSRGVFFAWRPAKYAQDLHYGWRNGGVIRPENSGPRDFMSAGIEMRLFDG